MAALLNPLANMALLQGESSEAEEYYRQSVTLNRGRIATLPEGLGNLMFGQGNYHQAEDYLIEFLRPEASKSYNYLSRYWLLWIRAGHQQNGSRVLAFVLHDPASMQEIRD
jgi:tetratricopeptide (TPR) repeat protein